jgi:hypothetical protein
VNDYYSATSASGGTGWKFTSSDAKIAKNITLPPGKAQLTASYTVSNYAKLYVRFGLSPDLLDLMQNGQANLSNVLASSSEVNLLNQNPSGTVRGYLRWAGAGLSGATFNPAAADRDSGVTLDTVQMRNQAQTQQIEIEGASMTFAVGFETGAALTYDSDGDGLPDWWENQFGLNASDPSGANGANADSDGDGRTSLQEYVIGLNPTGRGQRLVWPENHPHFVIDGQPAVRHRPRSCLPDLLPRESPERRVDSGGRQHPRHRQQRRIHRQRQRHRLCADRCTAALLQTRSHSSRNSMINLTGPFRSPKPLFAAVAIFVASIATTLAVAG